MSPLTKVVYKPDTQSTEEYTVIVNAEEYKKWKDGDKSVPLSQVVDSFDVFHSNQGSQGKLGKASNQQLDTIFGTHKDIDVVEKMLTKGKEQSSEGIKTGGYSLNIARTSASVDTRGKSHSGI